MTAPFGKVGVWAEANLAGVPRRLRPFQNSQRLSARPAWQAGV